MLRDPTRFPRFPTGVALSRADQPDAQGALAERLRDIEALADTALSRLDEQTLLETLLDRVKQVLQADTAAVLLLDQTSSQLVATAASGIEEEGRSDGPSRLSSRRAPFSAASPTA